MEPIMLKSAGARIGAQALDTPNERMRLVNIHAASEAGLTNAREEHFWDNVGAGTSQQRRQLAHAIRLNDEQLLKNQQIKEWLTSIPVQYRQARPLRQLMAGELYEYRGSLASEEREHMLVMIEEENESSSDGQQHETTHMQRHDDKELLDSKEVLQFEFSSSVHSVASANGQPCAFESGIDMRDGGGMDDIDSRFTRTQSIDDITYIVEQMSDDFEHFNASTADKRFALFNKRTVTETHHADCTRMLQVLWQSVKANTRRLLSAFKSFLRNILTHLRAQQQNSC